MSDRAGRAFESGSPTRHAHASHVEPHEQEKRRFLRVVCQLIRQQGDAGVFESLVLVAPAHALTELTSGLDQASQKKLIGTLAKDLTKVPAHELSPHLKEWVRPVHRAR